jgi:hypothetical protein
VNGASEYFRSQFRINTKMGHLSSRMNPGIRSSTAGDSSVMAGHLLDSQFDRLLNRGLPILPLPAIVGSPVVAKSDLKGSHDQLPVQPFGVRMWWRC